MKLKELLLKFENVNSMDCSIEEKIELKLKLVSEFKSHWCKEQRGYCANIFVPNLSEIMKKSTHNNTLPYEIKMAIQNANEPQ